MGTVFKILAVLITISILVIGQYNNALLSFSLPYNDNIYEISLLVYGLIVFAFGILAGTLLMLGNLLDTSYKYSKLKKQYEKTSITKDSHDDKIKLLENKIETLEAALKKALEK